ncbi:F-box protein [Tanacetum coccineum]
MDSRPSTSSDVSSGFASEREKAIGCLEKEKPTHCLNSKEFKLSLLNAVAACVRLLMFPFKRKGIHVPKLASTAEYFSEMAVEGNRFRPTVEIEMLEGTLKTIEDTMAHMDKEVYAIYRHMSNIGSGAATGKLQSRLQGEEDLQGKRGSAPKEHSKGRMDVVGWNFVMYNRSEQVNVEKAMDSFLKGAARGSTLAMVDAGLVYWEIGKKDEGVRMYKRAAELGDPAGQCNLGISYLQGEGDFSGESGFMTDKITSGEGFECCEGWKVTDI